MKDRTLPDHRGPCSFRGALWRRFPWCLRRNGRRPTWSGPTWEMSSRTIRPRSPMPWMLRLGSGRWIGSRGTGQRSRSSSMILPGGPRWREALRVVLRSLHAAGVRREDVTISVGVGRHHAVDDAAMRNRVGAEVADSYPCYSPPVDEASHYDDLGETPQGVPVKVFRPVAEANLRILIGSVLPHLQAGFGGGYKLIFPGCSHRSTLAALHGQGLGPGGDAGRLLGGNLATNPMRVAIRASAALLPGPCFSISHLLGDRGQVLRVVAGSPDEVQETPLGRGPAPVPGP